MADYNTPIQQIVAGSGADVRTNDNFDAASPAMLYGRRAGASAGLTWGYYGGRWSGFDIANGTVTLTGSATNYIVVDQSDGSVSVSTSNTNWNDTANYARAYKVTTSSSAATNWEDHRGGLYGTQFASPTGLSPVGRHAIYVSAAAMSPSFSSGCATLATVASGSGKPDMNTLDFDKDTVEYAQFGIVMPKSWDEGTVTARFVWSHATAATNFGVTWQIQAVAISDGDAIGASFGTAQSVTDTGGTADTLYHSAETSAMTVAGTPAAEDMVYFRVSRLATGGSDTLAVDARLHGVVLFINTDAATDA